MVQSRFQQGTQNDSDGILMQGILNEIENIEHAALMFPINEKWLLGQVVADKTDRPLREKLLDALQLWYDLIEETQ